MARKKVTEPQKDVLTQAQFSKEELLLSEQFQDDRDILKILLISEAKYTVEQVFQLIEAWKKEEEKCQEEELFLRKIKC